MSVRPPIPLTVIGGYLGAGKTTLVNQLVARSGDRRLGIVVNDFGELGIDADRIAQAGADGVIDLPNGCVCCSLTTGLLAALEALADRDPPVDHVVIEASGVADPRAVAAWAHRSPYRPGGVFVLAAADAVRRQADDRLIGVHVRRQLAGADLVVATKLDLVTEPDGAVLTAWLAEISAGAPVVRADEVALDTVVLVGSPGAIADEAGWAGDYRTATWQRDEPVTAEAIDQFVAGLGPGVLRIKGWIGTPAGTMEVDVVGRRCHQRPTADRPGSTLVAIGIGTDLDGIWRPLDG